MTSSKMSSEWPNMDPMEQWESAYAMAVRQAEAENDRLLHEEKAKIRAAAERDYNTTRYRWGRIGGIAWALAVAVIVTWSITQVVMVIGRNDEAIAAKGAELSSWTNQCIISGGYIYRDAENPVGLRLCVMEGRISSTHD